MRKRKGVNKLQEDLRSPVSALQMNYWNPWHEDKESDKHDSDFCFDHTGTI